MSDEFWKLEVLLCEITLYNHLSSCKNVVLLLHHLHDLLNPLKLLMVQLQKESLHPFDAVVITKSTIDQIEAECMYASIAGPTFIQLMNKIEQKKI
uniref:Uncharacterized protein n=1 Tax=Romanomermis culicivorax TaxID=13658 RepID=A0A915I978_ROMCU